MSSVSKSTQFYSGFSPQSIPGCALWLDAADLASITFNGSTISQWNDKSGNSRNATQTTGSLQPSYSSSAKSIVFGGASYLNLGNIFSALGPTDRTYTIFVVDRRGNANSATSYWIGASSGILFGYLNGTRIRHTFAVVSDLDAIIPVFANPDPIRIVSGGYSGSVRDIVINGTTAASQSFSTASTDWNNVCIGFLPFGGINTYYNGQIYEIIIYNNYLSLSQRQQIEGYLARKWGVTSNLPTTHLYRSIPPTLRQFTPLDIGDCVLWYDGADRSTITFNGSNVSSWANKGSAGPTFSLSQATTASQPSYTSMVGLVFNSNAPNTMSSSTSPTMSIAVNAYVVFTPLNTTRQRIFSVFGNTPVGAVIDTTFPSPFLSDGTSYYSSPTITSNVRSVLSTNIYSSSSRGVSFNFTENTNLTSSGSGQGNTTRLLIGGESTVYYNGTIHEILAFSGYLTTLQRQAIEGYLADKWGLRTNLPSTHPLKLIRPLSVPFLPTQISSCAFWVDAADSSTLTLSGSNVTAIRDKSPLNKTITLTTAPTYNSTIFNGYPALVFGSGNKITAPITATGLNATLVAAFKVTSGGGFNNAAVLAINAGSTGGGETAIGYNGTGNYNFYDYGSGGGESRNTTITTSNVNVLQVGVKSSVLGNMVSYVNGFDGPISPTTYSNAQTTISIGAGGFAFLGNLAEAIVYSNALSTTERKQIEGYLAWKWGLRTNLPTTHPYYKFNPS